jgi:hypothetical protein
MIARNFQIELDASGGPVSERSSFTMVPEGLRVRLRPRAPGNHVPAGIGDRGTRVAAETGGG